MLKVVKVIGNPGTGKTKYLVDHTVSLINMGIPSDQIAYLAFTRKAAQEALDRLTAMTGLTRDQFLWVRTLHSLAFNTQGIKKEQMMTEATLQGLLSDIGVMDDQEGKQIIQMHEYARIAEIPLMESWERMRGTYPVPWTKLLDYHKVYTAFKENLGRYDFYDLLDHYVANPVVPVLHTVLVDEAQDLSPIQWSMIKVLSDKAHVLMVAGDPHQAIFNFCGADSSILTELEGEEIILPKSNRIPYQVQVVSRQVLSRFADPDRYPYEPANHPGKVEVCKQLVMSNLALHEGTWMFLARTENFLEETRQYMFNAGLAFESRGSWSKYQTGNDKLLRLIEAYEKYVQTGDITPGRLDKLRKYCSHPERSAAMNQPWQQAFDAVISRDKKFLEACRGDNKSNIVLSTIHGSKGGEADNVVIFGDYTRAVATQFETYPAQEFACLYVAVTRAKKRLILVYPERQYGYVWREFV